MKSKDFPCTLCGKSLCSGFSLQRHIACIHDSKKIHTCLHCLRAFASKYHLRRHSDSKHTLVKRIKCLRGCDALFASKEARNYHHRFQHEGMRYTCRAVGCGLGFCSAAALKKHCQKPHVAVLRSLQTLVEKQRCKIAKLEAVLKTYGMKSDE